MSRRPRRKFEQASKNKLIAQIESGQITATQAARTHSISPTVISYWRKQFQVGELSEGPTRREKSSFKGNGAIQEAGTKRMAEAPLIWWMRFFPENLSGNGS